LDRDSLFSLQRSALDFSGDWIRHVVFHSVLFGHGGANKRNYCHALQWDQRPENRFPPFDTLDGHRSVYVFLERRSRAIFAHQAQTIYQTEIRKKQQQSLFGTHDIWIRAQASFINIDTFDPQSNALERVMVFLLNPDFSLRGLVEIPRAKWNGHKWEIKEATEWSILADGNMVTREATTLPAISETPDDLKLLARGPDEFSFFDLQREISEMKAKGIDTTSAEVDLQTKLALSFISPLMVLLSTPFALKRRMPTGLALSFGAAMVIGFGYWVLTGFCISLGHSGALPAWIAAWLPNSIFALIGLFYFTAEE
jgi:lipopolysaccharide export system permease protein